MPKGDANTTVATGLSLFGAAIAATYTQAQEALPQGIAHEEATAEAIVEAEVDALFETDEDSATPMSFSAKQTPAPQPTTASAPFERTSSTRNSRLLRRRRPSCASVRLGLQADPSGAPALRSGNARLSLRAGPLPQQTAAVSAARGAASQGVTQVQSMRLLPKAITPASGQ